MGSDCRLDRLAAFGNQCSFSDFSRSPSTKTSSKALYTRELYRGCESDSQLLSGSDGPGTDGMKPPTLKIISDVKSSVDCNHMQFDTVGICGPPAKPEGKERGESLANDDILLLKTLKGQASNTIFDPDLAENISKQGGQKSEFGKRSPPSVGTHGSLHGVTKGEGTGGVLKYALHLRFICPPLKNHGKDKACSAQFCSTSVNGLKVVEVEERRFYIYGDLRVVFPQRHSDADEGKVIVPSIYLR